MGRDRDILGKFTKIEIAKLKSYKEHQFQILTASLDHQSTFMGGPACKNKIPIWRMAAILKIDRITITQ